MLIRSISYDASMRGDKQAIRACYKNASGFTTTGTGALRRPWTASLGNIGGEVRIDVFSWVLKKKVNHNPIRTLRVYNINTKDEDPDKLIVDSRLGKAYVPLRRDPFESMEQVQKYLGDRFTDGFYRKSGAMVLQYSCISAENIPAI